MREINGEELVKLKSEGKKFLLDMYGVWCGPCKMLLPKLESLSNSYEGVEFVKMDVDKNQEFAMSMGVRSIPSVLIYDGNELVNRSQGVQPESFYKDILNTL